MLYTGIWGFGSWTTTFASAGMTNTTPVLIEKFGWDEDEAILYNTTISSCAIVGLVIGGFVAGLLVPMGRRRTIFISMTLCMLGALISMIAHEVTLGLGRFVLGTGAAIFNIAISKSVLETIPGHISAPFASSLGVSMAVGLIPVYALGAILPDVEDKEALKNDEMWRVIWLAPALIAIIVILLTMTLIRQEPILFCVSENRDDEAIAHLKKVYRKAPGVTESLDDILR